MLWNPNKGGMRDMGIRNITMAVFPDIRWPIYPIQETSPDISYKVSEKHDANYQEEDDKTRRTYSVDHKVITAVVL